ncbi:docking domain of Afi1 for Arf3 in vesicle trafficking-domain-containing protein [Stachybotrys elegans]|uniref:Docking domain of Afi1 for Arf3 in vesicle trafficking-domain-containing protein n=1 Tax=Stachybotrys elegans TaxID=80388 RepID=A0A8K0T3S8_9HYPO|nr:docking domain of Afi1 for Arf3 in vesicle trafficking-domain-containing protein [Stachybotrys elegans]
MATALPFLSRTLSHSNGNYPNGPQSGRRTSLSSFPSSRSPSQMSHASRPPRSPQPPMAPDTDRTSDPSSKSHPSSLDPSSQHSSLSAPRRQYSNPYPPKRLRSQFPRGSTENHVEYILVASFDIDKGPTMRHQYPVPITGNESMLAELMLPDRTHERDHNWTIFFLHKDTSPEEEDEERRLKDERRARRRRRRDKELGLLSEEEAAEFEEEDAEFVDQDEDYDSTDSEPEGGEGPPLIYVLNLVYTKHDKQAKRGAVVNSMAICTRHPFLHIYKPLLLLALEEYFKSPVPETLALLFDAVNAMDLSLMPKLTLLERHLLLASDNKDLFVEKFEQMIQQRIGEDKSEQPVTDETDGSQSPARPAGISRTGTKAHVEGGQSIYAVPRDTHEFESKVMYKGIPIPIKVPTAVMPETVGDFSLIKLIQNFSDQHAKSPQSYALHPHLTTSGTTTHPIMILVNALLTQKRVIFLGHKMPSGEVAEAVLAACSLASGGILRGFTRHAFPYTDLTKIDALLNVPGFIAGVTNPAFELHHEWWDVLCDLNSGRIKISNKIEPAILTEGQAYFQQQHPSLANIASGTTNNNQDLTGDGAFMADILRSIAARHGERVIRAKWRDWVLKFTRVAAQFEESVFGASALYIGAEDQEALAPGAVGHGYVWPDDAAKNKELAGNVTRIEGWRNTRSYYSYIQDLAQLYQVRPLKGLDLAHLHDRLRMQRLSPSQSADIYLTLAKHIHSYEEICLLLSVAPESHAGLFYVALGLLHKDREVRQQTADLLERISEHSAGQHWWRSLSRFEKLAFTRVRRDAEAEVRAKLDKEKIRSPLMSGGRAS